MVALADDWEALACSLSVAGTNGTMRLTVLVDTKIATGTRPKVWRERVHGSGVVAVSAVFRMVPLRGPFHSVWDVVSSGVVRRDMFVHCSPKQAPKKPCGEGERPCPRMALWGRAGPVRTDVGQPDEQVERI